MFFLSPSLSAHHPCLSLVDSDVECRVSSEELCEPRLGAKHSRGDSVNPRDSPSRGAHWLLADDSVSQAEPHGQEMAELTLASGQLGL